MKCSDCKEKLYLYAELNEEEKKKVDIHLDGCETCNKEFVEISSMISYTSKVRSIRPEYKNADFLTNRIMERIDLEGKMNFRIETSFSSRFFPFLRIAMSTLSMVLLLLLYFEFDDSSSKIKSYERANSSGNTVSLSNQSISDRFSNWKENKALNPFWKSCFKENDDDKEIRACIENYLSVNN